MRHLYSGLISVVALSFAVSACNSDHAIRSPDLPSAELAGITVGCPGPTSATPPAVVNITVGQVSQCSAQCTYKVIDKHGNDSIAGPQACGGLSWKSNNTSAVTVVSTGISAVPPANTSNITGQAPGSATITASVDGGSASVPINVAAAQVTCSIVYQKGVGADPTPGPTCLPSTNGTATAPVGVTVPFRAAVRLNNGTLCYAPDAPASQPACPANLVSFSSTNVATADIPSPPSGVARTNAIGTTDISATGSTNHVTLTVTAPVLNTALCVESLPPSVGCQAYTAPTVVCATDTVPNITAGGAPFQFRARAFFNVNTPSGQVCDVTANASTVWDITSKGSNASSTPTVNTTGAVSGGSLATTGAQVRARYTPGATTATGTHLFNVVINQVIANNSLIASATTVSNDPTDTANFAKPTRAACIGSYDLVEGLAAPPGLPAQKKLFSALRRCPSSALQGDGSCDPAQLSNVLEDVTNAETANNTPHGKVTWAVSQGYWDGSQCVESTDPVGDTVPAEIGDNDALFPLPARYTAGAAFSGNGDSRIFMRGAAPITDNGVGVSTGPLRIGTACMTATYAEGAATAKDGITLIILPVTNDSLLTDPNATSSVDLCNTLVPLFELGASPGGANGAVVQVLSAVSTILNPLLFQLSQGSEPGAGPIPVDDLLTQVVTALNPITGPLSTAALDPILSAVNDGVYTPLNCAIGQILLGLATQDPAQVNIQACAP